jgi:hypothetical protein
MKPGSVERPAICRKTGRKNRFQRLAAAGMALNIQDVSCASASACLTWNSHKMDNVAMHMATPT